MSAREVVARRLGMRERALRNAREASAELSRRRLEREEVRLFLEAELEVREGRAAASTG